ncbi:hypothetical protein IscW_ISCW001393 [Ixodes scapularis]|uniref:Uncharacterized protein n=1 Tax=Ixodes scapularis TaxID=6945 RepID=B7P0J4_IXOSC|nr:hypothetical protein IscW_ISCW001393 [Ixodes scapularis]|eukprot:XP_002399185.1 hypothetical protein IscW_ISCW001393 [Ixodes scapularis]
MKLLSHIMLLGITVSLYASLAIIEARTENAPEYQALQDWSADHDRLGSWLPRNRWTILYDDEIEASAQKRRTPKEAVHALAEEVKRFGSFHVADEAPVAEDGKTAYGLKEKLQNWAKRIVEGAIQPGRR